MAFFANKYAVCNIFVNKSSKMEKDKINIKILPF